MNEQRAERRQRFSFFCPSGREPEARTLLHQARRVRLVAGKNQIRELRATPSGVEDGVRLYGVASSQETLKQVNDVLADARIAGYSPESRVTYIPRKTALERKFGFESKTTLNFYDGSLEVEHNWGKRRTEKQLASSEWRHIVFFSSTLGSVLTPAINLLYHEDRRQFFRILVTLTNYRERTELPLADRVILDWTIAKLEEIAEQEKK